MNSLVKALVSGSAMGNTTHREQSGQLVLNTLLQTIGSIGK
jgi:hypothetical protein